MTVQAVFYASGDVGCRDCKMNLNGPGPQRLQANQSASGTWQLCSLDCRMRFLRRWLRVHLEECARIGKPLVIG